MCRAVCQRQLSLLTSIYAVCHSYHKNKWYNFLLHSSSQLPSQVFDEWLRVTTFSGKPG